MTTRSWLQLPQGRSSGGSGYSIRCRGRNWGNTIRFLRRLRERSRAASAAGSSSADSWDSFSAHSVRPQHRPAAAGVNSCCLIRVRCKAFTTRREEGLLQQRDLLGSPLELLAIVLDRHLLLAHELLQLANHPLAVGHTLRKIGTSVLHALLNPAGVESVSEFFGIGNEKSKRVCLAELTRWRSRVATACDAAHCSVRSLPGSEPDH